MVPLFLKADLNKFWHDVQNEVTLICAKFGKDLFSISKVIGRKTKWPQFFGLPCTLHYPSLHIIKHIIWHFWKKQHYVVFQLSLKYSLFTTRKARRKYEQHKQLRSAIMHNKMWISHKTLNALWHTWIGNVPTHQLPQRLHRDKDEARYSRPVLLSALATWLPHSLTQQPSNPPMPAPVPVQTCPIHNLPTFMPLWS